MLDRVTGDGLISFDGFQLYFDPSEPNEAAALVTNGSYEPETLEVILQSLRKGATFVDLGAHIGLFSLYAARQVGDGGVVYAFEPTPSVHEIARRNFEANRLLDRIRLERLAVGDRIGEVEFLIVPGASQGNSVARPSDVGPRIKAHQVTLDSYFEQLGWPAVDLVKMDIEGQELAAIRGMQELVRRNCGLSVIFEYHRAQMRRAGTHPLELFCALAELGFNTFTALHRARTVFRAPADLPWLDDLAKRANLNVLAEQS